MKRWLAGLAVLAVTGCASEPQGDDVAMTGQTEDELLTESQLTGRELPAGTFALTFDDGPSDRTKELAEYLHAHGVKAAFFINGKNVPGRQKHVDAVLANGHLLGNHTEHHLLLTSLSSTQLLDEVRSTDADIRDALDGTKQPWILRAPFGGWNGSVARTLDRTDMKKYVGSVFWDVGGELTAHSAADWNCWSAGVSKERCAELYLEEMKTRKRGIVLMHDAHAQTIDMFEKYLFPAMKAKGYKFAAITDVPQVKRAIAGAGTSAPDDSCFSATLGKKVAENACVESSSNQTWYRCVNGEWQRTTASDAKCTRKYPL